MRAAIYNDTFTAGQLLRSTVNGAIFTVTAVTEEAMARGPREMVIFRHHKTGAQVRVPLETARRLMLEEVAEP